ncbi:hypothetical protein ACFOET_19765 [Parapedobacter deserti]|uniref:Uncharacterized protein n=1 Tax=Parapedobacter deserti TaxID=1912957 RepID=A0ABV7JUQ9_9SPHI
MFLRVMTEVSMLPPGKGSPVPPACLPGGANGRGPPFRRAGRLAHHSVKPLISKHIMQTFIHFWTTRVPHIPDAAIAFALPCL